MLEPVRPQCLRPSARPAANSAARPRGVDLAEGGRWGAVTADPTHPLTRAERLEFEQLKGRLATLWRRLFPKDEEAYTSVVVPSVSVGEDELERHPEARFFEEILLFFLIRLRNPRARLVYATCEPIPPAILDYYLLFLACIPASHARARFTNVPVYDRTPQPLAEKLLERPRLLRKLKAAIPDPERAYLTTFRTTFLECRLALALGIPLNGPDPGMDSVFTKSEARRVFAEAGIPVPAGVEDLHSVADLVRALGERQRRRPGLARAVVELDTSYWADGRAIYTYSTRDSLDALREGLTRLQVSGSAVAPSAFLERLERQGGAVEEHDDSLGCATSAQLRINPARSVFVTSTHDEIGSDATQHAALGCRFPAADSHRLAVQQAGQRVARVLADRGVVGRVSIELMAGRSYSAELLGRQINLGVGGATHPVLAVRYLTGGRLDAETGLFQSPTGRPKFYRATDALASPAYRRLSPEDLIEILVMGKLNYSPRTESGALFYMLGAISELGRVGLVAIGNSRDEAEAIYERIVETLDRESGG